MTARRRQISGSREGFPSRGRHLAQLILAIFAMACLLPGPVRALAGPAKEVRRAPLAVHPLEPPCPLALESLRWHFDLQGIRHGYVPIRLEARLRNPDGVPREARLMLVTADTDAQVSLKGLGTEVERLVVPYPNEDDPDRMMVPVCLFRILLMPFESTLLGCDVHQLPAFEKIDQESTESLVETVRLPERGLWRHCPNTQLEFDLPPHLSLVVRNRKQALEPTVSSAGRLGRRVIYQVDSRLPPELRLELTWTGPRPVAVLLGSAMTGPCVALLMLALHPWPKRGRAFLASGLLAWVLNFAWMQTGQAQGALAYSCNNATWLGWLWWEALVGAPLLTAVAGWLAPIRPLRSFDLTGGEANPELRNGPA